MFVGGVGGVWVIGWAMVNRSGGGGLAVALNSFTLCAYVKGKLASLA